MANLKNFILATRRNEDGYVIISSLMVLVLVTIVGVMSVRTSNSDLEISTNQQFFGRSFYAAEAARAFVYSSPLLYGSDNTIPGLHIAPGLPGIGFPNDEDYTEARQISGGQEAFKGKVEYLNSSTPPRGSGFDLKIYRAHNYRMTCDGHGQYNGPRDSITQIESSFFRIGF